MNTANAAELISIIYSTNDAHTPLGRITFTDTSHGLLITPNLANLPSGIHGLHVHEHSNCGEHGNNAGGHLDPHHTSSHQGPYGDGHLGDLPVLYVDAKGKANLTTLAPRLTTKDLVGSAIMIHAGQDNYSDKPPLGGGGSRLACGVINA